VAEACRTVSATQRDDRVARAKSGSYLQDEIVQRAAKEPIVFDWYAQIAEKGRSSQNPSLELDLPIKDSNLRTSRVEYRPL